MSSGREVRDQGGGTRCWPADLWLEVWIHMPLVGTMVREKRGNPLLEVARNAAQDAELLPQTLPYPTN